MGLQERAKHGALGTVGSRHVASVYEHVFARYLVRPVTAHASLFASSSAIRAWSAARCPAFALASAPKKSGLRSRRELRDGGLGDFARIARQRRGNFATG